MALHGKVAIVTGCSSGIGLATTKLFLASGATVFGVDLSPPPSLALSAMGHRFHLHQVNLLDPSAADDAIEACISRFGSRIDVLANVAGIMDTYQSADSITDDMWDRVMGINSTVPVKMMRAVLGRGGMKERRKGSIVNVSSKAGTSGATAGIAYTASKHALIGATKNVAWRFRDEGIRCNAVCPGGVATNINNGINAKSIDEKSYNEMKLVHDIHMTGNGSNSITPDDIASAIQFLACDASISINGVVLPVDKSWSAI
ncbi:MAG: hypothetical protein M1818_006554 [Claussenomyces sp. TS43310]|nr:MAG: hypothetical protein M1818_006554 [Claussenomyces sp. TS43310]